MKFSNAIIIKKAPSFNISIYSEKTQRKPFIQIVYTYQPTECTETKIILGI